MKKNTPSHPGKWAAALILFVALQFDTHGQKITPTFGLISDAELALTAPATDPDAEAIVAFDIGSSRFLSDQEGQFVIRFKRTMRAKVFKRSGIRHAEVSIPFYWESHESTEEVFDIMAVSHNLENGHVIMRKLDPATVFEEKVSDRWRVKKFVIPDVKENTVFEFTYTIESPFFFNLPDWKFQSSIPTKYSEYSVGINPFYEYDFIAQGMSRFDYQNSEPEFPKKSYGGIRYNDQVTTFVLKNIPAFKDEAYIASAEDHIMKVDFQLSKVNRTDGTSKEYRTTWPALCKSLLESESFGKYFNASKRLAKSILGKEFQPTGETETAKLQSIVTYVRSQLRWNERYGLYTTKSPKDVFAQKTGSATEINLILAAFIAESGMEVMPVILSTRSNGKVQQEHPFAHYFNYAVVLVMTEKPFLTDGTEPLIAYNRLPIRCLNGKGLIVSKEAENWVALTNPAAAIEDVSINMTLHPSTGEANVSGTVLSTESEALMYKNQFGDDTVKLRAYLKDDFGVTVNKAAMANYAKPALPFMFTFSGTLPLEVVGDKVAVHPFFSFNLKENPFRQLIRSYPVDFAFTRQTKWKIKVTLPEGYAVDTFPQSTTKDSELVSLTVRFSQDGKSIIAEGEYTLKKAIYPPSDYSTLKDFFDTLVSTFNSQIVLKRG